MSTNTQEKKEFGWLRSAILPVHNYELKKFVPMGLILLCVLFNYTVLRNTKDALIGTAAAAGVEAIPYLKGIFVMAAALGFVAFYAKLSNMFSSEKLFYILVTSFLVFFGVFGFFIYPNVDQFHPSLETVQALQVDFPRLKFLISVWGVWTYSLFYVLSELWGSVMVSLLFWQFANDVIRTDEAKRFYPLFILLGNVALILSGDAVESWSSLQGTGADGWGLALKYLVSSVVGMGVLAMALYWWMHRYVLTDPRYYDAAAEKKPKKSKPKMGVGESIKYVFTNPYIGLIALLVLSYGLSINLIEFVWKKQLQIQFAGDPSGYNAFMGSFSKWTGIATIVIIFLTKGVVSKFGWFAGAVITPIMLAVTGGLFFAFVLLGDIFSPTALGIGVSATYAAVIIGTIQNILTKSSKYSLFDPTKEMAYIPLDQDLKTKGKAVVDVIGGRMGKGAGGYTIMALFAIFAASDAMQVIPYLVFVVAAVVVAWIFGVVVLNRRYRSMLAQQGSLEK